MATPAKRKATYQDVLDAPEHLVAEVVNGDLYLTPRPASRHARATSVLGAELVTRFDCGSPGGWIILDEPELHLDPDIVVPDIAGWRIERLPQIPDTAFLTLAPDWICEALSPSTEWLDRTRKLELYARAGIGHAWLVDARTRIVEVRRRHGAQWLVVATFDGAGAVRAEPFDAIEIDLSALWSNMMPPTPRGGGRLEPAAEYSLE
jgi:Uma2 family endonuclease